MTARKHRVGGIVVLLIAAAATVALITRPARTGPRRRGRRATPQSPPAKPRSARRTPTTRPH